MPANAVGGAAASPHDLPVVWTRAADVVPATRRRREADADLDEDEEVAFESVQRVGDDNADAEDSSGDELGATMLPHPAVKVPGEAATTELSRGVRETPLPRVKVFVLCCFFLTEAINLTLLFPFIPRMVESLGVPHDQVGSYSGLVASAWSFCGFLSSFFWGSLADRVGRRPVILLGSLGTAACVLVFGFSTSLAMAIAVRSCAGLLNGNVGVCKTMMSEVTDDTNKARAFGLMGLMFGVGCIIGPALGGFLSEPADKYPLVFSKTSLFATFPYLLPCIASCAIVLSGFTFGYWALEETLERDDRQFQPLEQDDDEERDELEGAPAFVFEDQDSVEPDSVLTLGSSGAGVGLDALTRAGGGGGATAEGEVLLTPRGSGDEDVLDVEAAGTSRRRSASFRSQLSTEHVIAVATYSLTGLLYMMMDEAQSLWSLETVARGGLGWGTENLGVLWAFSGVCIILINLWLFPYVSARIGLVRVCRLGPWLSTLSFILLPYATLFLASTTALWGYLFLQQVIKNLGASFSFLSVSVILNNSVPPRFLGRMNGVSQTMVSLFRAVGPASGGALFSFAVGSNRPWPLNMHLVFLVGALLAAISGVLAQRVPLRFEKAVVECVVQMKPLAHRRYGREP